jgi:hypothetical protein
MDFEKAIAVLADARVQFVVIGGAAMMAHGSAQVTQDLDVCYERSTENLRRLVGALTPYHPRLRGVPAGLPFRFDEETVQRGLNFTLITDLGDLDLLGEVAGLGFYPAVLAASELVEFSGKEWRILSLDGLIKAKRAAGRPRDLTALPELEALRELRGDLGKIDASPDRS